ncbi:GNAT family N-acetyltransferase [Candidatus Bathyarchaeota archaeon]|nr:MAG: GNAT family N-acetyltransferase [Candidatus Bathyarchaeota archaeon]
MIRVRLARAEDIEPSCEIAVEAWEPIYDNYRRILGDELFNILHKGWEERKANSIREHYKRHPNWMLVTEMDGEILGFITFTLDREKMIGEIGNNAVKPKYQGRGIGTEQYRRVIEIFKYEGMRFATVTTGLDDAHKPARRAYKKVGFNKAIPMVTYYMKLQ